MIIVAIVIVWGCKGEKSVEMGPAETVEEFSKALAACQWDKAMELCDTVKMQDYINAYRNAVSKMEKEDEGAMKVAKTLLESTAVTVKDVHKHDDKRIVTYTIETDGLRKTRQATLRKEEREWRVEAITEGN